MSMQALSQLIPPPAAPRETGAAADWAEVEAALDSPLPADYRALVDRYGTGGVGDFLWLLTPFTRSQDQNLLVAGRRILVAYRAIQADEPARYPFPAYPDEGGLLPWAVSDNGDTLYWQTSGDDPDQWPVVVFNGDHNRHETFAGGAAAFLADWLGGAFQSAILPQPGELELAWFAS